MGIVFWTCSLACHSTTDAPQQPQRCCDEQPATVRTGHDLINSVTGQPAAAPQQAGSLQSVSQSARPAFCELCATTACMYHTQPKQRNGDGIAVPVQERFFACLFSYKSKRLCNLHGGDADMVDLASCMPDYALTGQRRAAASSKMCSTQS